MKTSAVNWLPRHVVFMSSRIERKLKKSGPRAVRSVHCKANSQENACFLQIFKIAMSFILNLIFTHNIGDVCRSYTCPDDQILNNVIYGTHQDASERTVFEMTLSGLCVFLAYGPETTTRTFAGDYLIILSSFPTRM